VLAPTLLATDGDEGTNGQVRYSISTGPFNVDENTGKYCVNVVAAACTGTWECCYYGIDSITACCTHIPPLFLPASYPSSHPPLPCPLFTLPLLTLPLSSAPLSLLLCEGVIRVSDSILLDREVMPVFNLLLTATDQGTTPMASTIDIQVVLGDVNDNSPEFGVQVYNADVVEVCRHTVVSSVPIANM